MSAPTGRYPTGGAPTGGARRDARVDAYLRGLPPWQREVCARVRAVAHASDPELVETITRTVRPSFTCHGNVAALLATKAHVDVFVYDPTVADPDGLINQGHGNATARCIQVAEGAPLDEAALLRLFSAIIARNRAGGWRTLRG